MCDSNNLPPPISFAPGLYVLGTPIGNLGDLSQRGRDALATAAIVAAEDTRTSGRLVKIAGGSPRLISLTEHNVARRAPELVEAARSSAVVLVSDAGTPVVADPGGRLVEACHLAGVPVFALPGPSALASAISVSGFEGSDVHFLGFLPRQKQERLERLTSAAITAAVLVFFESPSRLGPTLSELAETMGDPQVAVCRELTKIHEEVVRGRASELAPRFAETRGECTVVVQVPERASAGREDVAAYMAEMHRAGARRSGAATEAARRFEISRSDAYELWPKDPAPPTQE
jgi:16S rRNA (cytidine1402-2'-O)-methyltransferase